jgi:hypothetical protein
MCGFGRYTSTSYTKILSLTFLWVPFYWLKVRLAPVYHNIESYNAQFPKRLSVTKEEKDYSVPNFCYALFRWFGSLLSPVSLRQLNSVLLDSRSIPLLG